VECLVDLPSVGENLREYMVSSNSTLLIMIHQRYGLLLLLSPQLSDSNVLSRTTVCLPIMFRRLHLLTYKEYSLRTFHPRDRFSA
jgi:hypothetical protein